MNKIIMIILALLIPPVSILIGGAKLFDFADVISLLFIVLASTLITYVSSNGILWSKDTLKMFSSNLLKTGYVAVVIGVIIVFNNSDKLLMVNPRGLSAAFLPLLYSLVLKYFVFDPIVSSMEKKD